MQRNRAWLLENWSEDVWREGKKFLKGGIVFALGWFVCLSTIQPEPPTDVVCWNVVTVELTGGSTFIIPSALPRTGAEGTK